MSYWRLVACVLAAGALHASDLQGLVRDSQGQPVANVRVQLRTGSQTFTAVTDSTGSYRFRDLQAGNYSLHAGDSKPGEADAGPFPLAADETKKLDLTLGAPAQAQFFDQPAFIVAGVTNPSERGGHGADPVYHSAENLTKETASLRTNTHHTRADEYEKQGNALAAAREYQRAAEQEPSEGNLFDWGVELLKHRAADQAGEVFARGVRLYPRSTRMLLGLAVALYSRGSYEQAAQRFFEAADVNPADPTPYMFLGRLPGGAITESAGYAARMERFARLQPENAWANYYYAACLWKRGDANVQPLLEKAVRLDPHLADAFLLLGVVFTAQNKFPDAISAYQKAITANPDLAQAHYRLAQAWRATGQPARAHEEIELYRQLSRQSEQKSEAERAAIQEFVFSLRDEKQ